VGSLDRLPAARNALADSVLDLGNSPRDPRQALGPRRRAIAHPSAGGAPSRDSTPGQWHSGTVKDAGASSGQTAQPQRAALLSLPIPSRHSQGTDPLLGAEGARRPRPQEGRGARLAFSTHPMVQCVCLPKSIARGGNGTHGTTPTHRHNTPAVQPRSGGFWISCDSARGTNHAHPTPDPQRSHHPPPHVRALPQVRGALMPAPASGRDVGAPQPRRPGARPRPVGTGRGYGCSTWRKANRLSTQAEQEAVHSEK
jgi:hypothetical protein